MLAIRDRKGVLWIARLDFDAALVLRDLGGIDVMGMATDADSHRRLCKPGRSADAIYLLCKTEADRRGLSSFQFGRRFRGLQNELSAAWGAEVEEFFRVPGPPPEGGGSPCDYTAAERWQEAYRLAGEAGVDPGRRTFGELVAMAEGARRAEWIRTAFLRAALSDGKTKLEELDITGAIRDLKRLARRHRGKQSIAGLADAFGLSKRKPVTPSIGA